MGASTQSAPPSTTWGIPEVVRTPQGKALLKHHLMEITEGAAFKGSHRSAQFLEYVVEKAASGNAEELKERLIGIDLFGRIPSYDTGEDAIVRVTASDVRKRLVQHYGRAGGSSEYRISLPPGGYVPEFTRNPAVVSSSSAPLRVIEQLPEIATVSPAVRATEEVTQPSKWLAWLFPLVGILTMTVGIALTVRSWVERTSHREAQTSWELPRNAPWASLFDGTRGVLVIASDPNIEEIQRITHSDVLLSDYANQRYMPRDSGHLSPVELDFINNILRGNKICILRWRDHSRSRIDGHAGAAPAFRQRSA